MRKLLPVVGLLAVLVLAGLSAPRLIERVAELRGAPQGATVSISAATIQFTRPMPGESAFLSLQQLRWCLREEIRIAALGSRVRSDGALEHVNRLAVDYNERCGSYRYERPTMEAARRDVEGLRSRILAAAVREAGELDAETSPAASSASGRLAERMHQVGDASSAATGASPPAGRIDLSVIVLDERGQSVSDAEIRLSNEDGFYSDSRTNDTGRAFLADVPAGLLQIEVVRVRDVFHYRFRTLLEGASSQELEILLPPP